MYEDKNKKKNKIKNRIILALVIVIALLIIGFMIYSYIDSNYYIIKKIDFSGLF